MSQGGTLYYVMPSFLTFFILGAAIVSHKLIKQSAGSRIQGCTYYFYLFISILPDGMITLIPVCSILLIVGLRPAFSFSVVIPKSRQPTRLNSDNFSELTNTLARLDKQWKIQQKSISGASRWKTLRMDVETSKETPSSDPLGALFADSTSKDKVYLLEPPNGSIPSCIIIFIGGAGLGTYPQIAYNELLVRLSNRLNAAVLAVPYTIALDHFALAKETGERALQAVSYCQDTFQYSEKLPVYSLSHSLGGKLSMIHYSAMRPEYAGMGIVGFNNFGFGETVRMAREFAQQLQSNIGNGSQNGFNMPPQSDAIFNQIFGFAETAVSAMGIDFSPTSSQTYQLIESKFDDEMQKKTRLFAMDGDTIHNSRQLAEACPSIDVAGLSGTHLTPVFFELGLDTIPDVDARNLVKDAMGGFEKASYGDEEELNELVQEVCEWILGKSPKRRPEWKKEVPLLSPATESDD